jgi:hypothetical protein
MTYKKIIKWLLVVLFVFGVITSFFGFFHGWPEDTQWKKDHKDVPVLKEQIAALEALDTPEWSGKVLEDKKKEVKTLSDSAKMMAGKVETLNTEILKAKKSAKPALEAEKEVLKAKVDTINMKIASLNNAINLDKYKTDLAAAEERIATGNTSVDTILYTTYVMIALVILSLITIIFVINSINNPFSLVRLLIGIAVIGGLVYGAWALAPGDMIQSETMSADQISHADLKMTDTVLYLAYLLFGGTIVALLTTWIVGAVRK